MLRNLLAKNVMNEVEQNGARGKQQKLASLAQSSRRLLLAPRHLQLNASRKSHNKGALQLQIWTDGILSSRRSHAVAGRSHRCAKL